MAKHLKIICIDERMTSELMMQLEKKFGIESRHPVPAVGCSLELRDQYPLIKRIVDIKNPDSAVLFPHLDCLAFKLTYGDLSRDDQIKRHIEIAQRAASDLQAEFPTLTDVQIRLLTDARPGYIGTETLEIPYGKVAI